MAYLLGSGGAAGLTLILIMAGQLVPRTYHKRILAENTRLQQANDILTAANSQLRDANASLSSSGQLTNQVVTALAQIASQERGSPKTRAAARREGP